jgi:Tol biopolymer transport system component
LAAPPPASWRRRFSGADVSHDGLRIATFQKSAGGVSLAILDRNNAQVKTIAVAPALEYFTPRWSPDDRAIAFIANEGNLQNLIYIAATDDGTTREIVRTIYLKGLAWLPDGSGLVYASAAGSTLRYPPVSIYAPCRQTEATIGSSQSAT